MHSRALLALFNVPITDVPIDHKVRHDRETEREGERNGERKEEGKQVLLLLYSIFFPGTSLPHWLCHYLFIVPDFNWKGEHLASRAMSAIKKMLSEAASNVSSKLQANSRSKLQTGSKKNNPPAAGGGTFTAATTTSTTTRTTTRTRSNIASRVTASRTSLTSSSNRPLFKGQVSTKRPNKETVLLGEDERSIDAGTSASTNKPRQGQGNSGSGNNALVIGLPDSAGSSTFVATSPRPIFKNSVATSRPNGETLLVGEREKPASPQPISANRKQAGTSSNGETVIRGLPESAVRIERTTSTLRPLFRPGTSTLKPNKETFLVGETERPVSRRG